MIHPLSDVKTSRIGKNTDIWQYVVILPGAVIGDYCNINAHCFIESDVKIGNNVTVKCGVYLWNGIIIENNVQIGPSVNFTNDQYPRAKTPFKLLKIIVKQYASIGANATILGGIIIGEYSLVGAGSVVTKNIPNNTLWVGNPARHVGYVCDCGQKLNSDLFCGKCDSYYKIKNNLLVRI